MEEPVQKANLEFYEGLRYERERFQRELHDGLAQELSSIRVLLKSMSLRGHNDHERTDLIQRLQLQMSNAMKTLYGIIHDTTPKQLLEKDLLESLKDSLSPTYDCTIEIRGNAKLILGCDFCALHLMRVAQEFVRNSVAHSNASKITLTINQHNNLIQVQMSDDGKGFELDKSNDGNGLRNIKQRLNALRATYDLQSSAKGTFLTVELNLSLANSNSIVTSTM